MEGKRFLDYLDEESPAYLMSVFGLDANNGSDDEPQTPPQADEAAMMEEGAAETAQSPPGQPPHGRKPAKLLLWQFVLLQLLRGHSSLSWVVDQWSCPGVFKFADTNEAARQWGQHKGNRNMSYEKMSRCIRDYYTRRANRYYNVMLPDGRGKEHRRVHFAFNLQHQDVLKFIRSHRPDYFAGLVKRGIVKFHP